MLEAEHPHDLLHVLLKEKTTDLLLTKMSENIEKGIMQISKTMTTSLIKGCVRGDSEKCCNWHNERIRVGSQMLKTFHMLKHLI